MYQKQKINALPRRVRPVAEINITPFTDVVLVLLVIFMISTPLIVQSNIRVNLPTVTSAAARERIVNQVIITVAGQGAQGVYLGDKAVTLRDLQEKITAMRQYNPDLTVVLFSDGEASFKNVASVLGVLNAAGVKDLNIAVNTEPEKKKTSRASGAAGRK